MFVFSVQTKSKLKKFDLGKLKCTNIPERKQYLSSNFSYKHS